jgi:hypothetical protein
VTTTQLTILCVASLVAIAIVAYARGRTRRDELDAEELRARRGAEERAERRAEADERAAAAVPGGPPDGSALVVHVDDRAIRGTRTLAGDPAADGWIVVDDAELLAGRDAQELGGRQWFREDRLTQLQEL